MKRYLIISLFLIIAAGCAEKGSEKGFMINSQGYFENGPVNVMVFQDIYPEGHQGGVGFIQHGHRVATNGDMRFEATPGQWQPLPKPGKRTVDTTGNIITMEMSWPDTAQNLKGFNPLRYPDLYLRYTITVKAEGESFLMALDLKDPLPAEMKGRAGINIELFPGWLFGKSWQADNNSGIFSRQPDGPAVNDDKGLAQPIPLATGKIITVVPESDLQRVKIESLNGELQLLDGRVQHNNGWFVIRQEVQTGVTGRVAEWRITPFAVSGWKADPVIHVSQVGYQPSQKKIAVIELDKNDKLRSEANLFRIDSGGSPALVSSSQPAEWGRFLRYDNLQFDFSTVKEPGLYFIKYRTVQSNPFRIGNDVYDRQVWQPVLDYFLPNQMCHMRVNEKYRVWHDICHMDDALMAPVSYNHIDGYVQGPETLTKYSPGEHVPGLNTGGWHDAGDFDLRVESQSGECYILSLAWEEFPEVRNYDNTTINQATHTVEINQPDGKPDILQQIEHGALSVVSGYKSLGRLYRGIIEPTIRQYVLLGDASAITDGIVKGSKAVDFPGSVTEENPLGQPWDDRYVFTEQNRGRELTVAQDLAATARALKDYNPQLSAECLSISEALFNQAAYPPKNGEKPRSFDKTPAATELFLATGKDIYKNYILENSENILKNLERNGWKLGRVLPLLGNEQFSGQVREGMKKIAEKVGSDAAATPYGVPYRPAIWGAGWDIQSFGMRHYFLVKGYPELFTPDVMFNALNFVLGTHPGENTASFASGVGSRSATVAYGSNRADWSYIPGGVVSGTALIRPDFAELLDFPFLWQQMEYVMGGGSSNYMFLVLAANKLLKE